MKGLLWLASYDGDGSRFEMFLSVVATEADRARQRGQGAGGAGVAAFMRGCVAVEIAEGNRTYQV